MIAQPAALDAAGQMALDEAILLESPPGTLVLRVYEWSGRGCTFGYSQPHAAARAACDARGWREVDPVRRATGGGIVFHDGDLTFSLFFPWDRTLAPETIYKNIHRGAHVALKARGTKTALYSPENRPFGLAGACFARAEPMDLVLPDGRKLLGGALRKKGSRGMYQGSLRTEGAALDRTALAAAVREGIEREFGRAPTTEIEPAWRAAAAALDARYRSREWNERR